MFELRPGIYNKNDKLLYTWEEIKTKFHYDIYTNNDRLASIFINNSIDAQKIILPDDLIDIKDGTFNNCTTIEKVVLSNRTVILGKDAFRLCKKLKSINLHDDIKNIGPYCFDECLSLKNVHIPNKLININTHAFSHTGLIEIIIPDRIKEIAPNAFRNAHKLKKVICGKDLMKISSYAFKNCDLEEIVFNENLKQIAEYAFDYNQNLSDVKLPEKIIIIGNMAFGNCNIRNLHIPKQAIHINAKAFNGCPIEVITVDKKNSIYYSENNCIIEKNKKELLIGCKNSIIPNDIEKIGNDSFDRVKELYDIIIPDNISIIGTSAFSCCVDLQNVTFGKKVRSLGASSFDGTKIKEVYLPGKIEYIGFGTFSRCCNLENIKVSSDNSIYSDINGVLFNKDGSKLILYPFGKKDELYIVPKCTNIIEEDAFAINENIKYIKLENVNTIEQNAFSDSTLERIDVPNVKFIGDGAFLGTKLKNVTLPKTLLEVGVGVFDESVLLKYNGSKNDFKKIEGLEDMIAYKKINLDKVQFIKTLEELIDEGRNMLEINKILKGQERETEKKRRI